MNTVELLGHYGGDKTHAMSAWTSTSRDYEKKRDRMPALLRMLAENGHHTPFEKSSLHFLVRCDTATHIHLLKHRIGVSVNGESARYKELKYGTDYVPGDMPLDTAIALDHHSARGRELYHHAIKEMMKLGVSRQRAKESARFFLSYTNQLNLDVMFNFRSFIHFQGLRNKPDAQKEVQDIARDMLGLVRDLDEFNYSLLAFGYR